MSYRNAEARLPEQFLTRSDAEANAVRAYWRGVFCGAVGIGILGGLAGWLS